MRKVMIASDDVKKIFDDLVEKCDASTDISELTKVHVIDYLLQGLYRINELESDEVQKALNKIFDRLLFREGEENAEIH